MLDIARRKLICPPFMKRLIAFISAEVGLIALGALGDRMLPDIPTWALGIGLFVLAIISIGIAALSLRDKSQFVEGTRIALRALEARDVEIRTLREVVRGLPQKPLGAGKTTYAKLPNGTNAVTLPDGTIRLALPVQISANFEGNLDGSLSVSLTKGPPPKGDKPDDS